MAIQPDQPSETFLEGFKYGTLDADNREIRLVTLEEGFWSDEIRCSLRTLSLHDQPAYEALSYVWGDPSICRSISLNGHTFEVTENLWLAMRRLRKSTEPRVFWIDAICINQSNNDEKSSQVSFMGEIYQGSQETTLWLGEDPCTVEVGSKSAAGHRLAELFEILLSDKHMSEMPCFIEDGTRTDVSEDYLQHFDDLAMFLDKPWWKRIWVIQEMVLPPKIRFVYGSEQFSYDTLRAVLEIFREHAAHCCKNFRLRLRGAGFDPLMVIEERVSPMVYVRERWRNSDERITLLQLRRMFSASQASVSRDLFYALLGIVNSWGLATPLQPDYNISSRDAIIKAVYACMVESGGASFLQGERISEDRSPDFPSWLPDLHVRSTPSRRVWGEQQRLKIAERFSATAGLKQDTTQFSLASDGTLRLQALKVDKVIRVGDATDPLDEFDKVPDVFRQWMGMIGMGVQDWPESPPARGSQQDSFWRTILNDSIEVEQGAGYVRPSDGDYHQLLDLWKMITANVWPLLVSMARSSVETRKSDSEPFEMMNTLLNLAPSIAYHVLVCLWGRRMIITEKGFIGLAPRTVREGDEVHILLGSEVPFILRPGHVNVYSSEVDRYSTPVYTVIGNGYLHGVMCGEAFEGDGQNEITVIALH
ncbi:hypothetical protein AnigIFM63309_002809 [Aspergillus niger]|nr:hypothetical protein AnigIFM63309_002809 [Aspergillus niger]